MKTQSEMVMQHLNQFGSISPREAYDDYQIMRLASRINDLRNEGIPIETEMRRHKITGKRYARYFITNKHV